MRQAAGIATAAAGLITPREQEILRQIVLGRTNPQIAVLLAISIKTVEWHRMNLMKKLDVHNAASLVRCALENGWVESTG
jgi:DNA-binding NarL/FixJ family response regulator